MTGQQSDVVVTERTAGKYLTFAVSQERYGFQILKVQEIIKVPHITPVPKTEDHIKGVINLRGKIIPVIDLRTKFGIPPVPCDEKTCIIVIHIARGDQKILIGIIVDTVLEVIDFTEAEISPPPNYGLSLSSQFIIGMGTREGMLNILIDIDRVISSHETERMAALQD